MITDVKMDSKQSHIYESAYPIDKGWDWEHPGGMFTHRWAPDCWELLKTEDVSQTDLLPVDWHCGLLRILSRMIL